MNPIMAAGHPGAGSTGGVSPRRHGRRQDEHISYYSLQNKTWCFRISVPGDPLRRPGHNLCSQTILLSHIISGGDEKKNSDITENILINRVNLWRPISREITLSREMSVRSPAGSWQHGAAPGHSLASPRQPRTAVTILCANLKKTFKWVKKIMFYD